MLTIRLSSCQGSSESLQKHFPRLSQILWKATQKPSTRTKANMSKAKGINACSPHTHPEQASECQDPCRGQRGRREIAANSPRPRAGTAASPLQTHRNITSGSSSALLVCLVAFLAWVKFNRHVVCGHELPMHVGMHACVCECKHACMYPCVNPRLHMSNNTQINMFCVQNIL